MPHFLVSPLLPEARVRRVVSVPPSAAPSSVALAVHIPHRFNSGGSFGQRFRRHYNGAVQGLRVLRGVLSHPRSGSFFRFQFYGLPSPPRRRCREMQWLRPLRYVLPGLRDFRRPLCTLIRKEFSRVSIFSTATIPAVREPSLPVRDLPQVTPLPPPPRWSSDSPPESPRWGASSSRWRTNWQLPSPSRVPFGLAPRRSLSLPDPVFRS